MAIFLIKTLIKFYKSFSKLIIQILNNSYNYVKNIIIMDVKNSIGNKIKLYN